LILIFILNPLRQFLLLLQHCFLLLIVFLLFQWFISLLFSLWNSFLNVVIYLFKNIRIRFDAMIIKINKALLWLALPRIFSDHVKIRLGGFMKLFIFFEWVFFKSIDIPCQNFEHIGIFLAIFGCFPEYGIGKIDEAGIVLFEVFVLNIIHLEIMIIFDFDKYNKRIWRYINNSYFTSNKL